MELVFSYVGYASETMELTLKSNKQLNIELKPSTQNLREVQVYGTRHNFGVQSSQMSAIAVSADQIRKMPTLLGEADVLKSLQRLPGVQSSGEGRAGIHVRGGENDQNLFSIDGITLYNPEHLQGFTSAINADLMDDVVLYKGAFPAGYGGRLSSVVDVSLREGDIERHRLSVTAGMLASRIQAEGPIWKGHTSYNIAARVSYFNAIVKPLLKEVIYDNPGQMNNYSHMRYYDINAKITHRFSDNDKLSGVFYLGRDVNRTTPNNTALHFEYEKWEMVDGKTMKTGTGFIDKPEHTQTSNNWDNLLGGLIYTHHFSPSLRLDASASYSGYSYQLENATSKGNQVSLSRWEHGQDGAEIYSLDNIENSTAYGSEIHDFTLKAALAYNWHDTHALSIGLQGSSIGIDPSVDTRFYQFKKAVPDVQTLWNIGLGEDRYKKSEMERHNQLGKQSTLQTFTAYAEDDWNLTSWLKADIGLRLQGYKTDEKTHLSLEPRASVRLSVTKNASLKVAYARMSQGMHLLSSGSLTLPSEIWIPISGNMNPGISDQLSAGFSHELHGGIQYSVEGYYKWLRNVVDYQEGHSFLQAHDWEEIIAQGDGRAYGIELLAQKNIGSTTGQVSYTWSKSLRTFDREGMVLNDGREYYAIGDRRHSFNISITQRLSKNWDFSAAWTYQTGRRATISTTTTTGGIFDEFNNYYPTTSDPGQVDYTQNPAYEEFAATYYTETYIDHIVRLDSYRQRNSYIMPSIHRLDISLSHHGSIGIGEMICDIGVYNLYCQQNISSVYWGYTNNRRTLKGVCMFPIMPSISLTLKL
jgi:outer membrane receptor protein involved in Fe transport